MAKNNWIRVDNEAAEMIKQERKRRGMLQEPLVSELIKRVLGHRYTKMDESKTNIESLASNENNS